MINKFRYKKPIIQQQQTADVLDKEKTTILSNPPTTTIVKNDNKIKSNTHQEIINPVHCDNDRHGNNVLDTETKDNMKVSYLTLLCCQSCTIKFNGA